MTSKLRALEDKSLQNDFKIKHLPYLTFGGVFKTRKDEMLVTESGLICVDLDDIENVQSLKEALVLKCIYLVLLFTSPRGTGLKLVFRCNPNFSFKENYWHLSNYLTREFAVNKDAIDKSCASISKACFLCHDLFVYLNPLVNEKDGVELIPYLEDTTSPSSKIEAHRNDQEILISGLNLFELPTFKYHTIKLYYDKPNTIENLIQLSRLTIRDFGELRVGKRHEWFLRLAIYCNRFGMKKEYALQHCKTLFSNHPAIMDQSNQFSEKGDLIRPFENVYRDFQEDYGVMKSDSEEWQTPLISEEVYNNLPQFVKRLTNLFSNRERDVFFLGFLTLLSTLFPKLRGKYGNKYYKANLFLFVSAPPASGKGVLSWIRTCGEKIHVELLEQYQKELKEYEDAEEEEKKEMKPPMMKKLFIPADNTYAMLIKSLEASRVFGLVMDTEADTLSVANKSEHGNFSVVFRKLFEHETIEYERKTTKEYFFIENPACSIIISGTPKQVNRLLNDAENGFTSRFLFYDFTAKAKWKDMFEENEDFEYIFKSVSVELASFARPYLNDFINGTDSHIQFILTKEQGRKLNSWFSEKLDELTHLFTADISGSIKRLGVIHFRLAMIITVLRQLEFKKGEHLPEKLICSDEDFEIAHSIVGTLLHHTVKVFMQLQLRSTFKNHRLKKDIYLEKLPAEFDYSKAKEVANYLSINHKTAENYLRKAVADGKLTKLEHNHYKKV